jgi:ubiquinone biosynthesis protein UbiJ
MTEEVQNLTLELLKKIQLEQMASRDRDREIMNRLAQMESMIARIGRDNAHAYAEQVEDRHAVDALRDRIERIERRLELGS